VRGGLLVGLAVGAKQAVAAKISLHPAHCAFEHLAHLLGRQAAEFPPCKLTTLLVIRTVQQQHVQVRVQP
jgi:hypothetical protein